MRSLKLLGPLEVNLCPTRLHSPSCLCRADELWEAASAQVLHKRGEGNSPPFVVTNEKSVARLFYLGCCWMHSCYPWEQDARVSAPCELRSDLVTFHKRRSRSNWCWECTRAERWQGKKQWNASLSLEFLRGNCGFEVIIVVRTVPSSREPLAVWEEWIQRLMRESCPWLVGREWCWG